jgi:hypothetical protein
LIWLTSEPHSKSPTYTSITLFVSLIRSTTMCPSLGEELTLQTSQAAQLGTQDAAAARTQTGRALLAPRVWSQAEPCRLSGTWHVCTARRACKRAVSNGSSPGHEGFRILRQVKL